MQFLNVQYCHFSHLSYNGTFEKLLIITMKTPFWWNPWCVETCRWIDKMLRTHIVVITVGAINSYTMRGTFNMKIKALYCIYLVRRLVETSCYRESGHCSSRTVHLKCDGTRWHTGGEVKWKLANGVCSLHTTSEHGVSSITTADAHTSATSSRLNWRAPLPRPI